MASSVNFGQQQYFGFDPRTVPPCALWLDAADSNALVLSGSTVPTWRDKSGNARDATSVGSPTLTTGALNGLSVVTFNGSTQYMTCPLSLGTTQPLTLFVVARSTTLTGFRAAVSLNGVPGARGSSLMLYLSGTSRWWFSGGNGPTDGNQTTLVLSTARFDINANYWRPSFVQMNINGTAYASSSATPTSLVASSTMIIGRAQGGIEYWSGPIAEILVYSNTLTSSQREQVEGYLALKWGLQSNFPNSHPYRRLAPAMRLFQPVDIDVGALLWLDAADTTTITGSPVTQWRDKSGRGSNAVTGLGSVVAGTAINSLNTLRFGLNTTLNLSNFVMPSAQTSVFYIIRGITSNANASQGTGYFIFSRTTDNFLVYTGNEQFFSYQNTPAGRSYNAVMGPGGERNWGNLPVPAFFNATSVVSITGVSYSSSNGLALPQVAASSVSNTVFTASTYQISSSRNIGDVNTYDLGELIVCDGTVGTAIAQQIEGYLARKWGVRNSLPTTHPYYNVLPSTALFTPAQVSGLTFWLDGADPSSMTLSGSTITQWRDKSSNGFVGTPAGSPLQTTLNGLPAVAFNGSTQYFSFGDVADLGSANLNIFCVMKFNSTANGSIVAKSLLGSAAFRYALLKETGNLSTLLESTLGVQGVGNVADSSLETRVLSWTWNRTSNILYRDGTLASSVAFANAATFNSTYTLLIGAYNNGSGGTPPGAGFYLNGVICELVFIFGPMTTLQRQQMEGYLAWKWSLQSRLPTTHPFLRFRP